MIHNLKKYLFYIILFLIPFNLRHIFNFELVENIKSFREHLSYSLYFFDIFFIGLLLIYVYQWTKNFKKEFLIKLFKNPIFYFVLAIIITGLTNKFVALSFYNTSRIIEIILFFIIAQDLLKNKDVFRNSCIIIFLSGVFQSILAIIQVIIQKSIGLKFLGESILASDILGVAKIDIFDEKFIRAYGTFPHANLLGVFLLFSLICGVWLNKKYFYKRDAFYKKNATSKINIGKDKFFLTATKHKILLIICFLGILVTFSRSVWLVIFIFLFFYFYLNYKKNIKDIWKKVSLKEKKILVGCFTVLFISFSISSIIYFKNLKNTESYQLRKTYNSISIKIIKLEPWDGVGVGNFSNVLAVLKSRQGRNIPEWHIQPVHNFYLLIASEIGLIGLGFFALFLLFILRNNLFRVNNKNSKKPTSIGFKSLENPFFWLIIAFLFLGLFDHYFWTLPQGQIIFWLSLAFFESSCNSDYK